MLVQIAGIGAYPASKLSMRFDMAARIALAPLLGLCVGTCIATTLLWFAPASDTFWVIPLVAGASIALVMRRGGRVARDAAGRTTTTADRSHGAPVGTRRGLLVDALQLLVVVLAVAAPITYTFVARNSVGPVGYRVGDAQGYVASIDAAQRESLPTTIDLFGSHAFYSNLEQKYATSYAVGYQELDATPLSADVDELAGLWGTDTQSAFLVAFLVAGALGLFASVRHAADRRTWAAALGGALFGGGLFLQLFFDGSEGALLGLSVLVPLGVLGACTLRTPRTADLALLALLTAGLIALYPLYVPEMVVAGVFVAVAYARGRRPDRRAVKAFLIRFTLTTAAIVAFNVVDFTRAVRYWSAVVHGSALEGAPPSYPFLTAKNVASWLLQTRQFYFLESTSGPFTTRILVKFVLPTVLILVAGTGLRRHLGSWILLIAAGVSLIVAAHERITNNCSYCEDRSLLPLAPIVIFLLASGIAWLAISRHVTLRGGALLAAAIVIAAIVPASYAGLMRFRNGAYYLDRNVRAVLGHLPTTGAISLEGFNENSDSIIEQMLVYDLVEERAPGRVSVLADSGESSAFYYVPYHLPHQRGFSYQANYPLVGAQFDPFYSYVLTRMAGIATSRRIIARAGGVALERRVAPLDALADYGLIVPPSQADAGGFAYVDPYVDEPVQFVLSGESSLAEYLWLRFKLPAGSRSDASGPDVVWSRRTHKTLSVCVRAVGIAPRRVAQLRIRPDDDVQLTAVKVSTSCAN